MTMQVSTSEMRTYLRCEREHHYLHTLGYGPAQEATALRFDRLIGAALEAWWLWQPAPDDSANRLERALATMRDALQSPRCAVDTFDRVCAEELIRAYDAAWRHEPLETLRVEVDYEVPVTNPRTGEPVPDLVLIGRMSAIVRDRHGQVWVVDRTVTEPETMPYWQRLAVDLQGSVHLLGARALGYMPRGILYDEVGKPALTPRGDTPSEDETPDAFRGRFVEAIRSAQPHLLRRGYIVRFPFDDTDAAYDIYDLAQRLTCAKGRASDEHVLRNPDGCSRDERMCDYFEVCSHLTNIDHPLLFRRKGGPPARATV